MFITYKNNMWFLGSVDCSRVIRKMFQESKKRLTLQIRWKWLLREIWACGRVNSYHKNPQSHTKYKRIFLPWVIFDYFIALSNAFIFIYHIYHTNVPFLEYFTLKWRKKSGKLKNSFTISLNQNTIKVIEI